MNLLDKIDMNILILIQNYIHNYILDKIMTFVTYIGNSGIVWIVLSIILLINKKYRKIGLMCICALILTSIFGEGVLKHLVQRQRPFSVMPAVNLLINKPITYSFPSSHTSSSFAIVGIVWSQMKKLRMPVIILAIVVAFSRLYLFVHYPSDIFGGVILGLLCSKIVIIIFRHNDKKINSIY